TMPRSNLLCAWLNYPSFTWTRPKLLGDARPIRKVSKLCATMSIGEGRFVTGLRRLGQANPFTWHIRDTMIALSKAFTGLSCVGSWLSGIPRLLCPHRHDPTSRCG